MAKDPKATEQTTPAASGAAVAPKQPPAAAQTAPAAPATDDAAKKLAEAEARVKAAEEKIAEAERKAAEAEKRAEDKAEARKKAEAEAKEKQAEALEKDNADTENVPAMGGDTVYVFANLQSGQSFKLADGSIVSIEGMPVSSLKGINGQSFAGGKYGVTTIAADKWAAVMKTYGKMKIFQNGLVFHADTLERGKAMARERGGLRHGYEPIDPESDRTKTKPKDDKE